MMAILCCFSGPVVLRALGIPARPITNFASAHDTDANRSIDFYLDANFNTIDRLTSDSIWLIA